MRVEFSIWELFRDVERYLGQKVNSHRVSTDPEVESVSQLHH